MSETNTAAILPAVGKDLELTTLPVPTPGPNDVLIRTAVTAVNPIDHVRQMFGFQVPAVPKVIGSDTTGTVVGVGAEAASTYKVGDRVVAVTDGFATGDNGHESYQTFAVAPTLTTAKLPDNFTFLEGSTVSVVAMTAGIIIFEGFKFSIPGAQEQSKPLPSNKPILLVWGGAGSVGSVTIQLARILGFTVFTTASPRHNERLQKLGAEVVVDYSDADAAVEKLLAAAGDRPIVYAVDAINDAKNTIPFVESILLKSAAATASSTTPELVHVKMLSEYKWKDGLTHTFINSTSIWTERRDVGEYIFRSGNLTSWLAEGKIVPPPARVVPGGLGGLQSALNQIKGGGVSGEKLVVEVA
ncbi:hypothetical protein Sste5346_007607 [Sporothrix stenoceras]|uniref:Enoyl reductase (ER) domain-containing protein n=1 Tax=Sporothrix stenoceras TaxID=5173 RepID=A0ABR3YU29_9PEZI